MNGCAAGCVGALMLGVRALRETWRAIRTGEGLP